MKTRKDTIKELFLLTGVAATLIAAPMNVAARQFSSDQNSYFSNTSTTQFFKPKRRPRPIPIPEPAPEPEPLPEEPVNPGNYEELSVSDYFNGAYKVPITFSEEGGGSRPEIIRTDDRVFVVYHGNITSRSGATFDVKIYSANFGELLDFKRLVSNTNEHGNPTDSRITSDGSYLYLAYETAARDGVSYLWVSKYTLDDNFERVAHTDIPIAQSVFTFDAVEGDEKLDDPAPVVTDNAVYIITRYKSTLSQSGYTVYRVRELSKDLELISEFDVDLSDYIDGQARQTSAFYLNGYFYMAVPTTMEDPRSEVDIATLSDIVLVKLDEDWQVVETQDISYDENDVETYVTGFKADSEYIYMTYNEVDFPGGISSPLKIFDHNFNLIHKETVAVGGGNNGGLRPSLEVSSDQMLLLGNNDGENAVVYVFY